MALERVNLEHLPASHTIDVALFRNIKNASFLHQQLLAGNTDFEYALIDASVVSALPLPPFPGARQALESISRDEHAHSDMVPDYLETARLCSRIPSSERSASKPVTKSERAL